jgi:hypothetical protein
MNEETIIEKRPTSNGQQETKKEGGSWKQVTLGGVSGILMGAGLLYAGQVVAATKTDAPEETAETTTDEAQQAEGADESTLPVAPIHNDLSFGEAFAAARAEVGPGGVFIWHGGIYNTYTVDEWRAMTTEQKSDFAHQVNPEVRAHEVPTPTDVHPDVATQPATDAGVHTVSDNSDVLMVDPQVTASYQELENEDVHIVGYTKVDDHLAVGYDVNGDDNPDVAIIDVGDPGLSQDDIIVGRGGNVATVGDVVNTPDPNLQASMENPDVAPDMPDYMNDADVDDMNVIA